MAVSAYAEFVRAGVKQPSIWNKLNGQIFLGSDAFVQQMLSASGQENLTEIPRAQRRPKALALSEYQSTAKSTQAAMAQAYASGDYTMQKIAKHFGVHYSTVSRAVQQLKLSGEL